MVGLTVSVKVMLGFLVKVGIAVSVKVVTVNFMVNVRLMVLVKVVMVGVCQGRDLQSRSQ